jgi:hypothetical protein
MGKITTDSQALELAQKIIKAKDRQALAYRTGSGSLPEWVFKVLDRKPEFDEYMKNRSTSK